MEDETGRRYGKIFKIKITDTLIPRVIRFVSARLIDREKFYIVTPNPEIMLKAKKDINLRRAIDKSDFSVPDGVGLKYAAKFMDGTKLTVIPGRILFMELIKLANKKALKVVFIGSRGDTVHRAKQVIEQNYKNINILSLPAAEYDNSGLPVSKEDLRQHYNCTSKIKMFIPDLIFVGMTTPKQEKWIYKYFFYLPGIGAMTVGATFDYLAGDLKMPPKWMEKLGLEWLFRLFIDPKRYRRIYNAVVIFPWEVLKYKYFR
jgi:N-acetylglucosaminyldiphosphoundecaprenol N-acetyl-beta-D-mannosaminyltransferase